MCVCICVYIYVYIYIYVYVCLYVCVYVCMYMSIKVTSRGLPYKTIDNSPIFCYNPSIFDAHFKINPTRPPTIHHYFVVTSSASL